MITEQTGRSVEGSTEETGAHQKKCFHPTFSQEMEIHSFLCSPAQVQMIEEERKDATTGKTFG